ncbi:MAG: DNA polymerase III subunit beta [Puniceicoccales bacterium]|jgi:DNA polymerase-3 subunit beta|nr:DNA polymerase III subunit beta [Puniceicoccales bacterium]
MKFVVEKDTLIAGLQQVINIVGQKLTMPILSNVLIEAIAVKNQIALSTTNLDLGIRCTVTAKVERSGNITLPVKKFASIIKALPEREVTCTLEDEVYVHLSSGGSRFKILGLASDEFPQLPSLDMGQSITLNQMQFLRMLKSISYAQSKDENRYILNGVYFLAENHCIHFIATDGRRLAVISSEITDDDLKKSAIVPAKTIGELERILGIGENVQILITEKQIAFLIGVETNDDHGICDSIYVVSKIVEGKYPNYKQVIPSVSDYRIHFDREQLLSVVQRVALVADEKNYSVRLKFSNCLLEISAQSSMYGEARENLSVTYEGEAIEIAFNPQFLIDPLKVLTNDEIFFEFKNELSPGIIKNNDTFLCVVMPLRLN